MLPTPSAYESTPTDEFVEEVREHLDDPHSRLYLPGRKWHAQRTLSRMAPALLPTPSANDHTGAEKLTREARRGEGSTGGPSLRDLPKLLPTPMANPENPGAGGELRAALTHGPSRRNETGIDSLGWPNEGRPSRLLPTPTAEDSKASGSARTREEGKQAMLHDTARRLGASTSQPSDDGSNSPDQHLHQLTIEDG